MGKTLKKYLDYKLIGILSLFYLIFVVIYASKVAFLRVLMDAEIDWEDFILGNFMDWALIVIFIIFMVITTKLMIDKKTKLVYIALIHLFFSFFIGAFTIYISQIINNIKESKPIFEINFEVVNMGYIRLIDLHFLIYMSLVAIIYSYYYFQKTQENKLQNIKLQEQLSKAHLKALQSQMHPHFLFNTLNGIHSLMDIDINKSKSMMVDLSDILRDVIDKKDENLVELQEELHFLKKYINIKKARFSDQLKISFNVENGLENVLIPNMLIQPVLENSIKHGYDLNNSFLKVYINIYKNKDRLNIKIENDGKSLEASMDALLKKGTGLINIKERLETLYKNDYTFKIYNKTDKVITKIGFPIRLSVSEIVEK